MDRETIKPTNRNAETPSFDELAASQKVRPVLEFDALLGHPSAEDESAEEFSLMLREWRREGTLPAPRR